METIMSRKKKQIESSEEENKGEKMNTKEFLNFRDLAWKKRIPFDCEHLGGGNYLVQCEEQFMQLIGY